jgi:hypothetical protein
MTRLSNRQYPLLKTFAEAGANHYMTIPEAQRYDQRPFRWMLIQGWISYRPGRGFRITREGREAWEEFERTEIWRKNSTLPLTAYFDPVAYGLTTAGKSKLHVMKARGDA